MFVVNSSGNHVINLNTVNEFYLVETTQGFGIRVKTFDNAVYIAETKETLDIEIQSFDNAYKSSFMFISTDSNIATTEFSNLLSALETGKKLYRITADSNNNDNWCPF